METVAHFVFFEETPDEKTNRAWTRVERAANRLRWALYKLSQLTDKANFNPNQPRVAAGNSDGGEWTNGGGGANAPTSAGKIGKVNSGANDGEARAVPVAYSSGRSKSGVAAKLPNGLQVPDQTSPTGHMLSPTAALSPVAAAGRTTGETYNRMIQNPESQFGAYAYLGLSLLRNVGTGGNFDYQREGNILTGFTQFRQFRNVSNFNVGLFGQQAGLTLEETLSLAGLWASHFSSNAKPGQPYSLDTQTHDFIVVGYRTGQTGVYGPAASLKPTR